LKRLRAVVVALVALGLLVALGATQAAKDDAKPPTARSAKKRSPTKPPKPRASTGRSRRAPSSAKALAGTPWQGPDACRAALASAPARPTGVARIGAWNLHWFPDGGPGRQPTEDPSNLDWLACAIAYLRVDVLAVEEVKAGERPRQALDDLAARLSALSGSRFRALLDDCPKASSQKVGLLYDERRATLGPHATLGELNPHGEPCKDQLRPGFAAHFRFPGGLDLTVVAAHLKSGGERRSFDLRAQSFTAFGTATVAAQALAKDRDVLLLGDMNTMGCPDCSPAVTQAQELAAVDRTLAASSPRLRRLGSSPGCSHSYSGQKSLLDWAAAADLEELPSGRAVTVAGYCSALGCDTSAEPPRSTLGLSDHCPIVVDVDDLDRDP
jgi:endonuclease/exonuclease/phosphatase family metal-dependent hydrolase